MENNLDRITLKERIKAIKYVVSVNYRASKTITILLFVFTILSGLFVLVTPYLFKIIIAYLTKVDFTTNPQITSFLLVIVISYIVLLTIEVIIGDLGYILRKKMEPIPVRLGSEDIMNHCNYLDVAYFENSKTHDEIFKAEQGTRQLDNIFRVLLQSIGFTISLVSIIVVLLIYDYRLFILIFIGAFPSLLLGLKYSELYSKTFNSNSPLLRSTRYYAGLFSKKVTTKEVKLFSLKNFIFEKWKGAYDKYISERNKLIKMQILYLFISTIWNGIFLTMCYLLAISFYLKQDYTLGTLTLLISLLYTFSNRLSTLFEWVGYLFEYTTEAVSINKVLSFKTNIIEKENAIDFPKKLKHGIEFKNVTFGYPGTTTKVFENFSILVKPGENIAIVGENGAGKTTLIKLISRLYDVNSGEILIDGVNIKEYKLESIYENIGIIFQDFVRYEALVKENIAYNNYENKKTKLEKSTHDAGAFEFIKEFDNKFDEPLGREIFENGRELSVGQWQKIALARAFFKDSQILILDEPTAAIDAKAEYELFNRFEKLTKDKTTILISHRFSTVRMADKIVDVDNGKIVESGNHKELIAKKGIYHKLFTLQAKGYQME